MNMEDVNMEKEPHDLVAMVYHTEGRVNAIAGRLDVQGNQLDRIESAILNKQPTWNNATILSLVAGVAMALAGVSQYITLQLNPIIREQEVHTEWQKGMTEFRSQTHYEFGKYTSWIEDHKEWSNHLDGLLHRLEGDVRELDVKAGEAKVSRKAIGDYAKEANAYFRGVAK